MYEQQCTFYFVDKCDLFWVFCRWNPLQLFWTLNLCFTNPVSRSEIFSTKCIAYANKQNDFHLDRSKVVSSETVPAFGSQCVFVCFVFALWWFNVTQDYSILFGLICCGLPRFSESKCLRDEEVLQTLPVGTTASFYFSDLGPQLTWGTVSTVLRFQDMHLYL